MHIAPSLARWPLALATLTLAAPAFANEPTECGVWDLQDGALVECANPNDSPGPFTPPTFSLLVQQDGTGVTAQLNDGTTIDVDVADDGSHTFSVDGYLTDAADVADTLDEQLTDDEQAAVSEVLSAESETSATDELVDLLAQ